MRIVDRREWIRSSLAYWLNVYRAYDQSLPMPWTRERPLGYYVERMKALDPGSCSQADMNEALDYPNTHFKHACDECGKDSNALMRFGDDEPDYDNRWQDICRDCLLKAAQDIPA